MSVFVDTGAFLAYRNKKDKYHARALKLFSDALRGKYGQIYTTDYIYERGCFFKEAIIRGTCDGMGL